MHGKGLGQVLELYLTSLFPHRTGEQGTDKNTEYDQSFHRTGAKGEMVRSWSQLENGVERRTVDSAPRLRGEGFSR